MVAGMDAMLSSCRRAGGLFLQPPRLSQQQQQVAAAPARLPLVQVRAQAAPRPQPAERQGGPSGFHRPNEGFQRRGNSGVAGGRGRDGSGMRGPVRQPGRGKVESEQMRLNKAIASAGVTSRRGADELISEGKVMVNGKAVTEPGMRVDLSRDKVVVNGRQLSGAAAQRKYYFALNKPKGYICSNKSEHEDGGEGRLVINLFDEWLAHWKARQARQAGGSGGGGGGLPPRLFTVGRLDVQSVGLIFVTNDGDWAHKVMHPSSGITKEYSVTLNRKPRQQDLEAMAAGCTMDGVFVQPVAVIRDDSDAAKPNRIRVVVAEGRNREVRNLVEHAGLEVKTLRRVRIGGYRLPRSLAFGEWVELRPYEVRRVLNVGADRTV